MREPLQPARPVDGRESADDLLRRRISLVLWIVVVGNLLFAATDPWLNPGVLWQLSLLKVGLIAVQVAGLALLRRRPTRRAAVTIALLCGGVASAGGTLAAIIVHDPFTTPLLCMSAALLTATVIPWGARVQSLVAAINLAAGAAAVYLVVGLPVAQALVGMVVVSALSVYIARELAGQRAAEAQATMALQRHHAEMARVLRVGTMGEMAAQLAHELTQPLGAIANYAAGCRRRMEATPAVTPEMVEVVDRIAQEALRGGAIIRRLREFLQKAAPQRAPVDLNALVRVVAEMIDAEARETDVAVELQLQDGLPAVPADRIEIEQLLLNLVRNGLEAMHVSRGARPTLAIETRFVAPATVELLVRDSGPGLPAGSAAEIFEPFYTTKPGGLGMGLAISRTIVELHGGTLAAASGQRGTTFRVRLPLAPPPLVEPR
ncbi:MAG: ATP-binding protein [Deltaproteobacteria bacterium]|nr:ATP-binding protein [Deltaproteobacteria bacterium]